MSINGIAAANYGVEDVAKSVEFLEDLGLKLVERQGDAYAAFELPDGSAVTVRPLGDKALPASRLQGPGVHELIWGVSSQEALDRLSADLSKDCEIRTGSDGVVRLLTPFGLAMGFKLFRPIPLQSTASAQNSPGSNLRMNQWRKWRKRAMPKELEHIVFAVPDVNSALDFMRDRLGFKVTDVQRGFGMFLRAPASNHHHNIAFIDSDIPFLNSAGKVTFNHLNFLVDDIDEIMVGKMYMERKGWPGSDIGLGRHRISSGAFLYMPAPMGGEVEYSADVDRLDDTWVPLEWDNLFGFLMFGHNLPPFLKGEQNWDMKFVENPETVRHVPHKEYVAAVGPGMGGAGGAH